MTSERDAVPRRVRAGIVTPSLWRGGAEQWVLSVLESCDRERVEWAGLAVAYEQHAYGPMRPEMERLVPVGDGPAALDALYAHCDVVLLWGVGTPDQRVPPRPRPFKLALVSQGVGHWTARVFERPEDADALVGVSPAAISPIPVEYRRRAKVILNCYDPKRITARPDSRGALRAAWGVQPHETVVGYLGRISPEKNPEALIRLCAAAPHVHGVFVGWGENEHMVRVVKEHGVGHRVTFHGEVGRPGDVLAAFDWLLLPSHEEGCSITLLEAWAAGVPAIATPVGVVTEYPDLVRMVAIAPTGEAMAAALRRDAEDVAGTRLRVERARAVATTEYTPEVFGRNWTDFIVSLAGEPRERPPGPANPFAGLPASRRARVLRAAACPHRSRKESWHAVCEASVGGLAPHHVVTADDCLSCLNGAAG